ncbi:MAG TPA: hypothetical protein DDW52_01300 [Planctomycetaceae bacterium]|nr:hypothetical protein [Planctomycetaceae bacterium]
MRNPTVHGVGGVLSADIAVPEHARELDFYSSVLTTGDAPLWRKDLMNNLGEPIIGLGDRKPEFEMLPLQWMPHFQVADVACSAETAIKMGGKELVHGKDEDGESQWAVLADRDGAAFGVIPVVTTQPAASKRNVTAEGRISWLSLVTPDAAVCQEFYQNVIGWSAESLPTDSSDGLVAKFEMHIDEENSAAEIWQFESEKHELPSVWLLHLPVNDLAESLRRVGDGGGEVMKKFDGEGYAIVRDPVGVFLALRSN